MHDAALRLGSVMEPAGGARCRQRRQQPGSRCVAVRLSAPGCLCRRPSSRHVHSPRTKLLRSARPAHRVGLRRRQRVIEHLAGDLPSPTGRIDPRVRRAIEAMVQHRDQDLAVGELAARVGISESHLSHLFSEQVGVPVSRYRMCCAPWRPRGRWAREARLRRLPTRQASPTARTSRALSSGCSGRPRVQPWKVRWRCMRSTKASESFDDNWFPHLHVVIGVAETFRGVFDHLVAGVVPADSYDPSISLFEQREFCVDL